MPSVWRLEHTTGGSESVDLHLKAINEEKEEYNDEKKEIKKFVPVDDCWGLGYQTLMKRRNEQMTAKKLARAAYDNALQSINL